MWIGNYFSRRDFLTQTVLASGGLLFCGCGSQGSAREGAASAPTIPTADSPSALPSNSETATETNSSDAAPEAKPLIVYFSHSGNTRVIAEYIQKFTEAELWEVKSVKPYPEDYNTVVEQAKKEIDAGFQPEIQLLPENLSAYSTIFVGSPCWWGTVAPPIATFLTGRNLSGKTIAPFMTHEGSFMGRTVADLRKYCPQANVLSGLPIRGGSVRSASSDVEKWLASLK